MQVFQDIYFKYFLAYRLEVSYIRIYLCGMAQDKGIYIKIDKELKGRVNQYVAENKPIGGLSGLVKRFLIRKVSK